jgi:hypothetical protein
MFQLRFGSEAQRNTFHLDYYRIWFTLSEHLVFYPLYLGFLIYLICTSGFKPFIGVFLIIQGGWTLLIFLKVRNIIKTYGLH